METKELDNLAAVLREESKQICKLNGCTEDNHNCESYAYFDYSDGVYELADICCSDYAQKCYASYVCLPFCGSGKDLLDELENNLLECYW